MFVVSDIVYRKSTNQYLLVLSRFQSEAAGKGNYLYTALDLINGKHVRSYMPKGLYKKVE
jgi:hypothetical protein